MRKRAITGFFFVIVMLGSVLLGHYVFGAFYLVLSLFCLWEFYGLIKQTGIKPDNATGLVNATYLIGVFAMITYDGDDKIYHQLLFLLPVTLSAIFIQELFKKKSVAPFTNIAYTYL